MEILLNEEFRLIYFLILQAAILVAAWRFVSRRIATDWADRAADVLLLTFLVQYLCVTLPGLTGLLNPLSIAITTIAISAALFFAPFKTAPPPVPARLSQSQPDKGFATTPFNWSLLTCALFAIGYLAFMAWNQRFMPITANDAITYHFPAAVHWLQTGRLSLFETWFFNPANTYSPLAGSTFIAWWIAPPGNDVLARHVQAPALLLIFFAAVRLMRALGVRSAIAALIALALLLSKPFLRQSQIEKDDLYLAAFFACAAAGFAQERLRDPLGPWRIGVALGLLLAVKVSALLSLPVLLLVIDAPFRARWPARRYAIVVALVLLLAGPWYLRNLLLTGNPLFPAHLTFFGITLFKGIITTAPSAQFASLRSIWLLLTARDQSLPLLPMIALLLGAIAVWAGRIRMLRSDPLARLCLLGPPLALLVFLKTSPFPEARYLHPAFILLFASAAIAIVAWIRSPSLQFLAAAALLIPAWLTAFPLDPDRLALVGGLVASAALFTAIGLGVIGTLRGLPAHHRALIASGSTILLLLGAGGIYVDWRAYLQGCRQFAIDPFYRSQYGPAADVWQYVREKIPPTETLAYTNTFLIHPMYGFNHDRPLIYIPTRRGITHLHELPLLPGKLIGEQVIPTVAAALTADTDPDAWLAHLTASQATHLVIFDHDVIANPPEQAIVRSHPEKFEQVYQNPSATVYRLRK